MRLTVAFALLCCATAASGQGIILPPSSPTYGQDEFRASDGTSCRTSMDGSKRVEGGAFGVGSSRDEPLFVPERFDRRSENNVGVYVRFSVSLDARKQRIDCNRLFELELERKEIELRMMKESLRASETKIERLQRQEPEEPQNAAPL